MRRVLERALWKVEDRAEARGPGARAMGGVGGGEGEWEWEDIVWEMEGLCALVNGFWFWGMGMCLCPGDCLGDALARFAEVLGVRQD